MSLIPAHQKLVDEVIIHQQLEDDPDLHLMRETIEAVIEAIIAAGWTIRRADRPPT